MSNFIKMEEEFNPWSENDMEYFLQFCCPECDVKCQLKETFVLHAMEHPKYIDSLEKSTLKEEPIDDNNDPKDLKSPKYNYELSNENVKYLVSDDLNSEEEIITENTLKELSDLSENTTIESEIEIKSENIETNNDQDPLELASTNDNEKSVVDSEIIKFETKPELPVTEVQKVYQCRCGICGLCFEDSLDLERHVGKEHLPKHIDEIMPKRVLLKGNGKAARIKKCGTCQGCTNRNCRECGPCKDLKKYGGPGKLKQACVHRRCTNPMNPNAADEVFKRNNSKQLINTKFENDEYFKGNSKQSVITVMSIDPDDGNANDNLMDTTKIQSLPILQNSKLSYERPRLSYSGLITMAIRNLPDQKATLQNIYDWIMSAFPYYSSIENKGWQNSIRHNLSLNKAFYRTGQQAARLGGGVWRIDPNFLEGTLKKIRRK